MISALNRLAGVAGIVAMILFAGCSEQTKTSKQTAPVVSESTSTAADHSKGPELADEDKALAAAQRLCPVTDEELGAEGPPVKLIVKGEPVFICCKGCEKEVRKDENGTLAKVAELKKAKAGDNPNN